MKVKVSLYPTAILFLVILGMAVGCAKAPNDAQIASDIQAQISRDSGLQDKQLNVRSSNGVVTLSGSVDNDNQRTAAAEYASGIRGVKQVVNNLEVAPPAMADMEPETAAPDSNPSPTPEPVRAKPRPSPSRLRTTPSSPQSASPQSASSRSASSGSASSGSGSMSGPANETSTERNAERAPQASTAMASTPPPPPAKVTIASGTMLAIRLVDTLDTETAQIGQSFRGTLDTPLSVDGEVAIPAGYDVDGHIVDLKSAGKFTGQSVLTLQLDRITVGGKYYNIQTNQWTKEGSSRGKNTAEKVGVGAVIGTVIGAIAGGGKGAAIGAAAGGGVGGGVQAATKGEQINLPSETVLNFTLQAPVTVLPTGKSPRESHPKLDSDNQ